MAYGEGVLHIDKVKDKGASHSVVALGDGSYDVTSGASGKTYAVRVEADQTATCSCSWGHYHPCVEIWKGCSHMQAIMDYVEHCNRLGEDNGLPPEPEDVPFDDYAEDIDLDAFGDLF